MPLLPGVPARASGALHRAWIRRGARAEDAGRDGYPAAQTNHALPRGESQGSNEGARARKAHENTKASRARVEDVIGEYRHEHGVRHAGKTDQAQEQQ